MAARDSSAVMDDRGLGRWWLGEAGRRTARAPALKQGQPELAIISTSSMMRSAWLRQARKPWMHSTCAAAAAGRAERAGRGGTHGSLCNSRQATRGEHSAYQQLIKKVLISNALRKPSATHAAGPKDVRQSLPYAAQERAAWDSKERNALQSPDLHGSHFLQIYLPNGERRALK